MGKVFITDEVNDNYTANVTNAGKIQVENAANLYYLILSAHTTVSAATAASACYVKSVTLNYPATAATLIIYNTISSGSGVSGFGTEGANIVTKISFPIGHTSALSGGGQSPIHIPLNVYLSSGLSVGNGGHSANDSLAYVGCLVGGVITYQT